MYIREFFCTMRRHDESIENSCVLYSLVLVIEPNQFWVLGLGLRQFC
jgi:hypothetical protein